MTQDIEPDEDGNVQVPVAIEFREVVEYHLPTVVRVPPDIAADPAALSEYLHENDEIWIDHLDANKHCAGVYERDVLNVEILDDFPAPEDHTP